MTSLVSSDEHSYCRNTKRISWSAMFAGALIEVGSSFLLNLFGVAIGLSASSMSAQGVASLAIGGLLGLIVSTMIAMYFAGFASGYIGRLYVPRRNMSLIYGFTTWSLAVILSAGLTAHLGNYIDSYANSLTRNTIIVAQAKVAEDKAARHAEEQEDTHHITTVTPREATHGIAIGAFIVFALFFFGALASCVGAHHGMSRRGEE